VGGGRRGGGVVACVEVYNWVEVEGEGEGEGWHAWLNQVTWVNLNHWSPPLQPGFSGLLYFLWPACFFSGPDGDCVCKAHVCTNQRTNVQNLPSKDASA
jgi:hypothetical protein